MIPTSFVAGDSVKFEKAAPAFPASEGWEITWSLINQCGVHHFKGVAVDDCYQISLSADDTKNIAPGLYRFQLYIEKGTDRYTLRSGTVKVEKGFALLDGRSDTRTHAEIVLEAIECVIENRATHDQESLQLNNRQLSRTPITDLLKLRDRYRAEVAREHAAADLAAGINPKRKIRVRFVKP